MRALAFWLAVGLVVGAGTPVLGASPAAAPATVELKLAAPSALLMEPVSGQILWERDGGLRSAPASVTKLMTLLLAYEALAQGTVSLDDTVVVSEAAALLGGTQIWLYAGEEMPFRDILRAVAIGSANDAAAAMAEHIAGSEASFVARMNERAAALGMAGTRFANSHGLDAEDHYTCARDVARLTRELVLRHPEVLELTSQYLAYVREHLGAGRTEILNRNRLVRSYPGADGLKTGWTGQAGYCIAATARREATRLVAVVMGSASRTERDADTQTLLNYGFGNFAAIRGAIRGEVVATVPVYLGRPPATDLAAADDFGVVVPKGKQKSVERVLVTPDRLQAPVRAGTCVGEMVFFLEGKELGRAPLVAVSDVSAFTWPSLVARLFLRAIR